ncbi:MAG: hypothetical protein ACK5Q5_08280 [Planctomycetaceae bacterium]
MLRRTLAALLLSSVSLSAHADDPALPTVPGPTLGLSPIAEPTPINGTNGSTSTYNGVASPQPVPPGAAYSGPSYSNSGPSDNSGPSYNEYAGSPSTMLPSAPAYESPAYPFPMEYGVAAAGQPLNQGYAPPSLTGCSCQNGVTGYGSMSGQSTFTGGFGVATADIAGGHQAMGYHGGGMETYTGATGGGMHVRHPYYSYRRPWYANGPMSQNVSIAW